jgi:2-dehydropantoate 2-reductase
MTRYIIIGAGAVGASLAAQFEENGIDYALIARGAQGQQLQTEGLTYQRPSGTRQIKLKVFDTSAPPVLSSQDVLVLSVKTQDVAATLSDWAWREVEGTASGTAADLPLITLQNGLAAEDIALRHFKHVYGASVLTPARYTELGTVVVGAAPHVAVVTIGRYPSGVDEVTERFVSDLRASHYLAEESTDISRWKAAKLLHNVRNALELFQGSQEQHEQIAKLVADEARFVLSRAGYDFASPTERTIDLSTWGVVKDSGIEPGQQSTWQSFKRGSSSEVDFLNGEVTLLARKLGLQAPYNEAVQILSVKLSANRGDFSLQVLDAIQLLVEKSKQERQVSIAAE